MGQLPCICLFQEALQVFKRVLYLPGELWIPGFPFFLSGPFKYIRCLLEAPLRGLPYPSWEFRAKARLHTCPQTSLNPGCCGSVRLVG